MNISNYIKINDQISTAGQPTKEELRQIAKEGFEVVINLAPHDKGTLNDEDRIVSESGMIYFHLPISWETPQVDRLQLFLMLLKTLEEEKKSVFIHCVKNYRVSVFMHMYKKFVWGLKDVEFVAPAEYEPNAVWQEILNMELEI